MLLIEIHHISAVINRSLRAAKRLSNTIKQYYYKATHQPLKLKEFCDYIGLTEEEVMQEIEKKRAGSVL